MTDPRRKTPGETAAEEKVEFVRKLMERALATHDREGETSCPKREDGQHCNCWYDGKACCACGDPAYEMPNDA